MKTEISSFTLNKYIFQILVGKDSYFKTSLKIFGLFFHIKSRVALRNSNSTSFYNFMFSGFGHDMFYPLILGYSHKFF